VTIGFTVVAAGATIAASVTHLATYGPEQWGSILMNVALALFPAVFLIFGPAVVVISLSRVPFWPLLSSLPRPVIIVSFLVFGYVAVDFFLMFKVLPGQPEQHGAEYFFNEHGLLVPIDVHQYNQALMHAARLFTGHEIWFFGLAAALGYQLDRVRRGRIDLDAVPRDDSIEKHPLPSPLSRSLTLQTMLSPEECATRLLQPAPKPAFALVGGYGLRGKATADGFRLELAGSNSSLVYAVGRFAGEGRPTFIRVLLTFKRWPLIVFGVTALLMPVWWLALNSSGFPFPWQGLLFALVVGVGGNFLFGLAQMRSLLNQIKQSTGGQQVSVGDGRLD
jgi:hypothetical protein